MTEMTMDRASFLLGYLTARLDCAPDILDMVAQAEAYLDGEAVPLPALAAMDPQPDPDEPAAPPAPKPKASSKATARGGGSKCEQVAALTREGLSVKQIAARLDIGKGSVGGHISFARKKGLLPALGSAEDLAIKGRRVGLPPPAPGDVTASLMGDPVPGRSAA